MPLSEFLGSDSSGTSAVVVAPKKSSWADESEDFNGKLLKKKHKYTIQKVR